MLKSKLPSLLVIVSLIGTLSTIAIGGISISAYAQTDTTNTVAPDNSAINTRDRTDPAKTADQAGNQMSDRDIMQKIRKAVVADKSLSTYAHNVKIIAENGKVTLKGPVKSDQEKQNIEAKATDVVGNGNVTDSISVKTSN